MKLPKWMPWRHFAAAGLFLVGCGLIGFGFGITFLRGETASPLTATMSFLLWGLAGIAFVGALRLYQGDEA